jgi:hypothetical protein
MNDQPPKLELKPGTPFFEGFTLRMIKAGPAAVRKVLVSAEGLSNIYKLAR